MHRFLQYGNTKSESENEIIIIISSISLISNIIAVIFLPIQEMVLEQNEGDHNAPQESLDVLQLQKRASIAEKDIEDKTVDMQLKAERKLPQSLPTAPNSVLDMNSTPVPLHNTQNCSSNNMPSISKKAPTSGKGADPKRQQCKKAKLLRIERKLEKKTHRSDQLNTQNPVSNILTIKKTKLNPLFYVS